MAFKKVFVKNYLTKEHYDSGKVVALIFLAVCFSASFFYWGPKVEIAKLLSASYSEVMEDGETWRLFSTLFVHGDLAHLLANSLMLYILMYFVTSFYGPIISILLNLIMGMVTNYLVLSIYQGDTTLVGISGVVYFLWGFWMILYLFIQNQYSIMKRVLRMGTVFLVLLVPTELSLKTSYLAHGIGFGLGVLVGLFYYLINRSYLHSFERWDQIYIDEDEYSELDEIALSYPEE